MKKDLLNKYTFLYMLIPTIIFLFGWCKFYIAIILSTFLICVFIKRYCQNKINIKNIKAFFIDNKKEIIITLLISSLFVFVSGIGGYVFQNSDHIYRNSIFRELVNKNWPVVYEPTANFTSNFFMVYYFAFWLPAALVGKIFNITLGYFFLYIWSILGIFLTFSYLQTYYKKNFYIPIAIFIFFSGLDIVESFLSGSNIFQLITSTEHLEWSTGFQFSSFTTQLFWVFNQAIPAWLLTFLILNEKDNKTIGINISFSLLFCTLPALALSVIALYKVFFENFNIKWFKTDINKFKEWFHNTFSLENIFVGIPIFIIFATFVKSNISGNSISFIDLHFTLLNIILTIFFEFLIYYIFIYKYQKKNKLFYLSLFILFICPFFKIGVGGDFCMRVSIPPLVILLILILESLEIAQNKVDKKFIITLTLILILGSFTPINEIKRTIEKTNSNTFNGSINLITCDLNSNFFGYTNDSIFYNFFAKK